MSSKFPESESGKNKKSIEFPLSKTGPNKLTRKERRRIVQSKMEADKVPQWAAVCYQKCVCEGVPASAYPLVDLKDRMGIEFSDLPNLCQFSKIGSSNRQCCLTYRGVEFYGTGVQKQQAANRAAAKALEQFFGISREKQDVNDAVAVEEASEEPMKIVGKDDSETAGSSAATN